MDSSPSLIRRTIIESGVREKSVGGLGKGAYDIMKSLTYEHENEKRELQQLNEKFSIYLNRVRQLEAQNKHLESELDEIKKKWGFDTAKIRDQYDNDLNNLRSRIDESERDKCLAEMRIKHAEYEADILKGKIDFIYNLMNDDKQKLNFLMQQRDMFMPEMSSLETRYRDMLAEIDRLKGELENNFSKLNDFKNELDGIIFDRVKIQNEIQTLGDQIIFTRALHEEEIKEFQSLAMPQFDFTQFYRMELTRAINDIRKDFEILNNAQQKEIEAYYKIRTEEMKQQVAEENRKLEEAKSHGRVEVMDFSSLKDSLKNINAERVQLEADHNNLLNTLRDLESDMLELRTERERREAQREMDLMQLNSQIQSVQESLRSAAEGNVSLRFEINTYRRLLEGEERHMSSSSMSASSASTHGFTGQYPLSHTTFDRKLSGASKSTQRRIASKQNFSFVVIEECDPVDNNYILIKNNSLTSDQDMSGWSINQNADSGVCTYYFPDNYVLKAGSQVRVYCSSASTISTLDNFLVADSVYKWLKGNRVESRLRSRDNDISIVVEENSF